uniref:Pleckstrin homology domain containing B1 n=1 Tax=Anser cygnoides TaxID=8845 RepID=A0A8B9EKA8_ANSCY
PSCERGFWDVQPPEGKSRECLLTVVLRDGSKTTLCAESEDDAVAWKMAVLEAKSTPVRFLRAPKKRRHRTGFGYRGGGGGGAPGVTHVIVREDPYRVSGDQMALGLLAGAATGAALGSFMWMPCWF